MRNPDMKPAGGVSLTGRFAAPISQTNSMNLSTFVTPRSSNSKNRIRGSRRIKIWVAYLPQIFPQGRDEESNSPTFSVQNRGSEGGTFQLDFPVHALPAKVAPAPTMRCFICWSPYANVRPGRSSAGPCAQINRRKQKKWLFSQANM